MKSLDLTGRSILVVEDEPLICLDMCLPLTSGKAMTLADRADLSAAVLDFNLGAVDSSPICS